MQIEQYLRIFQPYIHWLEWDFWWLLFWSRLFCRKTSPTTTRPTMCATHLQRTAIPTAPLPLTLLTANTTYLYWAFLNWRGLSSFRVLGVWSLVAGTPFWVRRISYSFEKCIFSFCILWVLFRLLALRNAKILRGNSLNWQQRKERQCWDKILETITISYILLLRH